jgi:hypothetical protein
MQPPTSREVSDPRFKAKRILGIEFANSTYELAKIERRRRRTWGNINVKERLRKSRLERRNFPLNYGFK